MFSEKLSIHLRHTAYATGYEFLCLIINIFGAILISRTVGPMRFADYTIVSTSVATYCILLRGYQPSIASAVVLSNVGNTNSVSGNIRRIGFNVLVLVFGWIILVKFLSYFSQVSPVFYLYGTALIPAQALTIFVSGVLQGLGNVQKWRLHIVVSTATQIPFLIIGAKWRLEVPFFILILSLPSVAYLFVSTNYIKSRLVNIKLLKFDVNWKSSILALFAASLAGTPLFFSKHLLPNSSFGYAIFFLSGLIITSNLSSMFGSFLLKERVASQTSGVSNGLLVHFLHAIPCFAYGVTFTLCGHWMLDHLIAPIDSSNIPHVFIFLATTATSIWSINFSIFEEFLLKIKTSTILLLLLILALESTVFIFTEISYISYFILHLSMGLIVLFSNKTFYIKRIKQRHNY
jgi:hypothetical protein